MSYLALYRQFRPTGFDEIIGQDHVVKTLINQINTNRVGHAYLFCGARGTGKTTAAKVFARAINCLSPNNGSPCGECEACKKLQNPANLDILEMDAASNNKVENVRDIRDKIQYPPVAGRYKVYIIDEVHMLTTEAFNALLKTLEEPPSHAVFILATTEVHKIPATILSRCLRFDFKLISTAKIAQFIGEIYDKVGKKYQKEALTLIAKAGEGSVRDALSIADICLSYSNGELTYNDVLEVLGTSDRAIIEQLLAAMFEGDTGRMLSLTDELISAGKSVSILNRDVASALRDILVIKTCSNAGEVLSLPQDKLKELEALSQKTNVHALLRAIEIFSVAEADLKYSTHPKIVFETAAVKASLPQADYNIDALMARISSLEKKLEEGNFTVKVQPQAVTAPAQAVAPIQPVQPVVEKPAVVEKPVVVEKQPVQKSEPAVKSVEVKAQEQVKEIEKPAVEKKPLSDEDADLLSLMATIDNGGFCEEEGGFFAPPEVQKPQKPVNKSINAVKEVEKPILAEQKKVEKPASVSASETAPVAVAPSGNVDKAWGAILRSLRTDKEIMLWVACQDVSVKSSANFIVIVAPGDNEYNLLSRQENINKLCGYASVQGYEGVKVVKDKNEEIANSALDEEANQVKDMFNGSPLTIKD